MAVQVFVLTSSSSSSPLPPFHLERRWQAAPFSASRRASNSGPCGFIAARIVDTSSLAPLDGSTPLQICNLRDFTSLQSRWHVDNVNDALDRLPIYGSSVAASARGQDMALSGSKIVLRMYWAFAFRDGPVAAGALSSPRAVETSGANCVTSSEISGVFEPSDLSPSIFARRTRIWWNSSQCFQVLIPRSRSAEVASC
jgi:hypothetical protein